MSEESEDKQKQAKKIETLGKLFGTPGSLFDLINFNKRPRRRAPRYLAIFSDRGLLLLPETNFIIIFYTN